MRPARLALAATVVAVVAAGGAWAWRQRAPQAPAAVVPAVAPAVQPVEFAATDVATVAPVTNPTEESRGRSRRSRSWYARCSKMGGARSANTRWRASPGRTVSRGNRAMSPTAHGL